MAPLREWLREPVDCDKLNASATRVTVTAVNAATGAYEEFDIRDGLTVEYVIANSSLPPVFPMTFIGDKPYWNGGLVSNTPLRCAINALEQINADDPEGETRTDRDGCQLYLAVDTTDDVGRGVDCCRYISLGS